MIKETLSRVKQPTPQYFKKLRKVAYVATAISVYLIGCQEGGQIHLSEAIYEGLKIFTGIAGAVGLSSHLPVIK